MSDPGYEPTHVNLPPVSPGGGPGTPPPTPPGGVPPVPTPGAPPPGDPPPPGADTWPWIIGGVVALIILVVLALLLLGGDDDSDGDVGLDTVPEQSTTSSTSTSSTSTTTSSTTTTTAPPATTSTTNAPPVTADPDQCREAGADPLSPEPAAEAVFVAWTRSDVPCARELMTDDALDELFSRSGAGATDVFQGCFEVEDPEPAIDCAFTFEGGSTHYLMNFSDTDGWQVFDVFQVAD